MKIDLPPTITFQSFNYDDTSVELTNEDVIDHALDVVTRIVASNFHTTEQSLYAELPAEGFSFAVFINMQRGVVLVIVSGHDEDIGYEILDQIDDVWTGKVKMHGITGAEISATIH